MHGERWKEVQPIEEFRYLVLAAQREGNRIVTETLRPLDLTPSQAEVLRVLQEQQPLSLIALGELLVCESGSPSRLVNGLVEAGLVKRVPNASNGRMVTLTLTEKGEEMATRVSAVEVALYEFIAKALEGQSLSEGIALLWRLVKERPAGEALARRKRRAHEASEAP
jgi:MarR family transcriptional regulator, organic hydroperoxide resistance regulator